MIVVTALYVACIMHVTARATDAAQKFRLDDLPHSAQPGARREWWSILILRDAFRGLTRFDQFQKSLDIAPNMLTRRLNALVESGLLERRAYCEHPPRYEYVLTERGRDFRPVLWALLAWGNRHFAPDGPSVVVVDTDTGEQADPVLVDRRTGKVMVEPKFRSVSVR
jgi:DNA-binding HxlR family transcriptional regulator